MEIYNAMPDSEFREEIAKNKTTEEFKSSINGAFSNKENFCYETNFDSHPLAWAEKAKELGYRLELHFYCLNSIDLAKKRVAQRTRYKGHFVSNNTIEIKWKEGYKNLNLYFDFFDFVMLIDNSSDEHRLLNLFSLEKKKDGEFKVIQNSEWIPKYAKRRYPRIFEILKKN